MQLINKVEKMEPTDRYGHYYDHLRRGQGFFMSGMAERSEDIVEKQYLAHRRGRYYMIKFMELPSSSGNPKWKAVMVDPELAFLKNVKFEDIRAAMVHRRFIYMGHDDRNRLGQLVHRADPDVV